MPFLISGTHKIDFGDIEIANLDSLPEELRPAATLIAQWEAGQRIFKLQTSGSTGEPKTIELYRDKIEYSARQTAQAFGLKSGDTLFCCLGLHYIAGFMMVMRALVIDCNIIISEPESNPLRDVPENMKIDFASFVPLQMETMLNDSKSIKIMNGMKAILLGGGPVSDALAEKLQIIKAPVYHTYSMTETYTHVAVKLLNGAGKQSAFMPLPGTTLSLDERGCLVIGSYLTDDQPLITNDMAEIYQDGSFTWIGRYDNVINSGGIKIQLERIEAVAGQALKELGMNPVFFATGVPDAKLGQKLVLVIEGEAWDRGIVNNFNAQLSKQLGKYEQPKEVLFVKEIVLTRTGKVDRKGTMGMIIKI